MTMGLHDQGIVSKNLTLMFDLICHYDWTYHLVSEEDGETEETEELSEATIAIQSKLKKLSNQNMAVRKRGVIERRTPDPEPLSGAFQTNSLFGGMEGGLFAGLCKEPARETENKELSNREEDERRTYQKEEMEDSSIFGEDDSKDFSEDLEEKEEKEEMFPASGEPWTAHPGMFSAAGGFGNKSVFDRLEALSREAEEEEPE